MNKTFDVFMLFADIVYFGFDMETITLVNMSRKPNPSSIHHKPVRNFRKLYKTIWLSVVLPGVNCTKTISYHQCIETSCNCLFLKKGYKMGNQITIFKILVRLFSPKL